MAGKDRIAWLALLICVYFVEVNPQERPSLSVNLESSKTVANVGEHVSLICTVTEYEPAPELHYYRTRKDSAAPVEVDDSEDYVLSVADNQAQFYCEAKVPGYPDMNTVSNTITTTVYFNATRITMTEKPPNTVRLGEPVRLRCLTDSSWPGDAIEWWKYRPGRGDPQRLHTPTESQQYSADFGTVQESNHSFLASKDDGNASYECKLKRAGIRNSVKINVTFPHTKVELKGDNTTAAQLYSVRIFECLTDESNPAAVHKWFESTSGEGADPSWQEIEENISSRDSLGQYGGKITVSSLSLKATKALNNRKYKCMSVYSSGNDSRVLNSSIATLEVKWNATEALMTERPLHPVKAGDTVEIKCETSRSQSGPPGEFVWFRNGQPITPRFRILKSSSERDGVGHYVSVLEFVAEKVDNEANFECRIIDKKAFRKTTVQVLFPPDGIKLSDSRITSWEGERKTLTCETTSSSNPPISLSMMKGEEVLSITPKVAGGENGGYNAKLEVLVDTNRSDNGVQYLCIATYMNSTTFPKSAYNNVKFNPTNISITEKPPQPLHAGMIFNITCEASSANPAAEILFQRIERQGKSWVTRNISDRVTANERNGAYNGKIRTSLMKGLASKRDNGVEFRCLVSDPARGFEMKDTTLLEVFYPPKLNVPKNMITLKEDDPLTLTCDAFDGNPNNYTYTWYHNGILIPSATVRVYRVENVSYTQGGTYRCNASNYSPGGVLSDNVEINVQYKPRRNPQFAEITTVPAIVSQSVTLSLHVIANPSPTSVTWSRQTGEKPTFNLNHNAAHATLKVFVTGDSDFGNYTATVRNKIGVAHFVFMLVVRDVATTTMPPSTTTTKGNGATVNIKEDGVVVGDRMNGTASAGFMITARLPDYVLYVLFVLVVAHL